LIFSSPQYFLFLPLALLCYWKTSGTTRLLVTVVASYLFYMSWMPTYGILLLAMTAANFVLGLGIEKARAEEAKKLAGTYLGLGLLLNVGALCYYKYFNFIFENVIGAIIAVSSMIPGLKLSPAFMHLADSPLLNVILPLGISFFVFEFVHYLSDVYKGDKAIKSFLMFAAFAAFFPSQIAGPIKRYQDFVAQMANPMQLDRPLFYEGASLIMQGLFKKVAIADPLGALIMPSFSTLQALSAGDAWAAALGFVVQVYCDFSGYTDMGRGSALLMGIRLPINFELPLLSLDISALWRRWHMSLGSWLRDYIYITLGGSRRGMVIQSVNLTITMIVCGLWHGASWHYILFGGLQGLALSVHRAWCLFIKDKAAVNAACESKIGIALRYIFTFAFITCTFALFRSPDIPHALVIWSGMLNFAAPFTQTVPILKSGILPIVILYFAFWQLTEYLRKHKTFADGELKDSLMPAGARMLFANPVRLATWSAALILMVASKPLEAVPFVYFQF
jgi:alginate O-acetyltransferase complex protein AlgI